MKLRKRLDKFEFLDGPVSFILASYLRFCFVTTRWQKIGFDELAADLKAGPVLLILWHGRLLNGPIAWPGHLSRVFTLLDPSPIGRLASKVHARLGMEPIAMSSNTSNFAASRKILKVIRDGHSVGIAADGPKGPGREAKQAALEWARASGRPVYVFSWSARRSIRLNTWDKLMLPLPFTRGAYVFRKWQTEVPRKLDEQEYLNLRRKLSDDLDLVTGEADGLANAPVAGKN